LDANRVATTELWVNKYAPTKFTDLLSDEQTNRKILNWLKSWDERVFGSQTKCEGSDTSFLSSSPKTKLSFRSPKTSTSLSVARPVAQRRKDHEETSDKLALPNSPLILMLTGSPGVGKTTLAHIIAKHAGYHPWKSMPLQAEDDPGDTTNWRFPPTAGFLNHYFYLLDH